MAKLLSYLMWIHVDFRTSYFVPSAYGEALGWVSYRFDILGCLKSQSLFDASELAGGIIWMHLNRCSQTRDARGINPLYAGIETISVLFLAQKENEVTSATGISIKKEGASLDTPGELS